MQEQDVGVEGTRVLFRNRDLDLTGGRQVQGYEDDAPNRCLQLLNKLLPCALAWLPIRICPGPPWWSGGSCSNGLALILPGTATTLSNPVDRLGRTSRRGPASRAWPQSR